MTVFLGILLIVVVLASGVGLMLYNDRRQHRRMLDITRGDTAPPSSAGSSLRPAGTLDPGGKLP